MAIPVAHEYFALGWYMTVKTFSFSISSSFNETPEGSSFLFNPGAPLCSHYDDGSNLHQVSPCLCDRGSRVTGNLALSGFASELPK